MLAEIKIVGSWEEKEKDSTFFPGFVVVVVSFICIPIDDFNVTRNPTM